MSRVLANDVRFDAIAHEYWLGDQRLPSVTEILRAVGVSIDFDELAASSPRLGAAIGLKRELGTALHADAHAYDDDDLDWSTVDPRVRPYLEAWATFRQNTGLTPVTRERLVVHPVFAYAGTFDGIFATPDTRLVLVDLKTGDPADSGCAYQTAAYLAAHDAWSPAVTAVERWGVQLMPGLRVPYRISRYTAWDDFHKFQAFLTTYHSQAARRRERQAA